MLRSALLTALTANLLAGPTAPATSVQAKKKNPRSKVRIQVPAGFPTDLPTPLAGQFVPKDETGSTWLLERSGEEAMPAQWDSRSGQVVFLGEVSEEDRGETLSFSARQADLASKVSIEPVEGGFLFKDGKRPVMRYQREPQSQNGKQTRANYIHPLYGLNGEMLTQDFPEDHPHHRGVFWAWHQLWVGGKRAGDPWINRDFLSVVKTADILEQGPVFATLKLTVHWTSPRITDEEGRPRPIIEETTHIRLFHANNSSQIIDLSIRLKPLLPEVKIGGADNYKEYSGFTVRLKPPRKMRITDDDGVLAKDGVKRRSPWADVSGRFGKDQRLSGVGILTHPSLPDFPPRWLLRHYGMQNVIYPGRKPIPLEAENPLILRNRLVIHKGGCEQARLPARQKAYAQGW